MAFDALKPKTLTQVASQEVRDNFIAVARHHAGSTAPASPLQGFLWLDTSDGADYQLKLWDGSFWRVLVTQVNSALPEVASRSRKFVHTQALLHTTWTVNHTLATTDLLVQAFNGSGVLLVPTTVTIVSASQVTIAFGVNRSGKAVLVG
jgi:hypothetical protein